MFLEQLNKHDLKASSLNDARLLAQKKAASQGFPTRKTEDYSYLNLKELETSSPKFTSSGYNISINHSDVEVLSLEKAFEKYGPLITNRFEKIMSRKKSFFSLVNHGWNSDTVCIFINKSISEVIEIEETFIENSQMSCPQIQFFVPKDVKAQLHHKIHITGENNFINRSVYFSLERGADVTVYETSDIKRDNNLFFHTEAVVKGCGTFQHRSGISGCKLFRNEIKAYLLEKKAHASLEGFWSGSNDDSIHIHVHCSHLAEETTSLQHYQGVSDQKARASFEGQIYVDRVAQKTDSYQLSKHLLLGDSARGFSKPNLEVFADDVKASHGATVTKLSNEELYYLTSRGISKELGAKLLKKGFLSFFLDGIKDKEVCREFTRFIK